ncbi:MAG: hypothetical protein JXB13_10515, partial [Phycisphaerae bacterium]|nr:hypothetical protein [Phycisphaerae bacterium]
MSKRLRHGCLHAGIPILLALWGCAPGGTGDGTGTQTVVTPVADELNNPTALLFAPDGRLLVAESGAGRIIALDEAGNASLLIDGFTIGTYSPFDIGPLSIASAADGSLIVGEGGERFGRERVSFYAADGTPGPDALVPRGGADFFDVALEPSTGRLFIASTGSNRVFVADPADAGGFAEPADFVADTTADPLRASAPAALAFDAQGRLLVGFADQAGGAVLALNTDPAAVSVLISVVATSMSPVMSIAVRPSDSAIAYATLDGPLTGSVYLIAPDGTQSTLA